jgi:hypothetical protein
MNKYITFFGIVFIAIALILTNPDRAKHSAAVKEILTKEFHKTMTDEIQTSKNSYQRANAGIGLLLGATLIDKIIDGYIDSENFYLFSLTKLNVEGTNRTIGFGILGKVYVSDKLKENIGKLFKQKKAM